MASRVRSAVALTAACIALSALVAAAAPTRTSRPLLAAEVAAVFTAHHRAAPVWDAELAAGCQAAAEATASNVDLRALFRQRGVVDGFVLPVAANGAAASTDVRGRLLTYIAQSVMPQQVTHFGAAEVDGRAVVVFVRRAVTRIRWPAPEKPRVAAPLRARLANRGYRRISIAVGRPDGRVDRVSVRRRGRRIAASIPFWGGPGRYVVEVVGQGPRGIEVLALNDVFVGTDVPALPTIPLQRPATDDPADALESRLVTRINAERRRLELPPLKVDPALRTTARRHAAAMARSGVMAHRLPGGYGAKTRLRRAGVWTRRFYENVAMAATVEQAHRELWDSPTHRVALVDPVVRRIGVGVVARASEGGRALFIVQHLAAR